MGLRVNRDELLQHLGSVAAGLSNREILDQTDCFVFQDGEILSFNDECACRYPSKLVKGLTGAIKAQAVTAILKELTADEVELVQGKEQLHIRGKGEGADLNMQAEVLLPIDKVDAPGKWRKLHPDFLDAVDIVQQCASKDEAQSKLVYVHLHPEWLEATDNDQSVRYRVPSKLPGSVFVRWDALKFTVALGMTEMSLTEGWLHFKNPAGLLLSCRRYLDEMDYPDMTPAFEVGGEPATLPKTLAAVAKKAEVFSKEDKDNNVVRVELRPGKLRVIGTGTSGRYWGIRKFRYDGPPLSFLIPPHLLVQLVERYNECLISEECIKVDGGKFTYVSSLEAVTSNGDGAAH